MAGPWDNYAPAAAESRPWEKYGGEAEGGSFGSKVKQGIGNAIAGAVRGAGSIGATLLRPVNQWDKAGNKIDGAAEDKTRRLAMDEALRMMGAEPNSLMYQGPKLLTEVAGTLGVGGALAGGARVLGAGPSAISAINTAGMTGGNVAGRMAAGGLVGGASAALVNPDDAGVGAGVGAALPPLLQGAGKLGSAVGGVFRSQEAKGAKDIAQALDLNDPQAVQAAIAKLRMAPELVPGSRPTVAQALRTPQAGITQRVVSDSAGGGALRDQLAAQNSARLAALERVAPTSPTGFASARQDMGEAIARYAVPARGQARAQTSALYGEVPQDEAMLYLPKLGEVRDKYFGPGVFTDRGAVDKAVSTANKIGTTDIPAMTASKGSVQLSLLDAVKRAGGINEATVSSKMLAGELKGLRQEGLGRVVYKNRGLSAARMAEKMHEAGFIPDEDSATLLDMLRFGGRDTFSEGADLSSNFRAMAESAMGDMPGAQSVPKKVTLKDFEDLRRSIGQEQRAASMSGNDTAAKALGDMKRSLDDRINEVVRGDGAADEMLPIDWADKLSSARASKVAEVERFGTGPQAAMFRKGSDGQPLVQGGEVASKFWGNRPGVADDVKSFRRLIDDNPQLLGQFRSMITTEGASTQSMGGNLGAKFAKWVENSLPGMKQAFDPAEVQTLRRIAADIKRSEIASAAGMAKGSNTYQNAQNALALGMLDSPLFQSLAVRAPMPLSVPVQFMRDTARKAKGERMANLLSDSGAAANALQTLGAPPNALQQMLRKAEIEQYLLRSAPVLAGDR